MSRPFFDARALFRDLRTSVWDATAALGLTAVLFVWFQRRVAAGTSATIEVMPDLAGGAGEYWMYWLCQAFGWSALLWAWFTVMLGLTRSSALPRWLHISAARVETLHRTTSLTTMSLMFGHALWFFAEEVRSSSGVPGWPARIGRAVLRVWIPGGYPSGTGVIAILIGLLALYLAIPLGLAFYARRTIGAKSWRVLHAAIVVVYLLSVWHTLLYSTNAWYDGWFRTTLWILQMPVAALLLLRLMAPSHRQSPRAVDVAGRVVVRVLAVATVVVLPVVILSGRDGGRTRGVTGSGLNVTVSMVWVGFALFVVGLAALVAHARQRSRTPAGSGPVHGQSHIRMRSFDGRQHQRQPADAECDRRDVSHCQSFEPDGGPRL